LSPMTALNPYTPILSDEILTTLPAKYASSHIELVGTVTSLNILMKKLYFYPPEGLYTVHDAILTIEAQDSLPTVCNVIEELMSTVQLSLADAPKEALSTTKSSSSSSSSPLCSRRDLNQTRQAKMIIVIIEKNQAPVISFTTDTNIIVSASLITDDPTLTFPLETSLETAIAISFLYISDPDFFNVPPLTNSFGVLSLPPISLQIYCQIGTIELLSYDEDISVNSLRGSDLVMSEGLGDVGTALVLNIYGSIDKVNLALKSLSYRCEAANGCYRNYKDVVTIIADDSGYQGDGGPLQTRREIEIIIT
jgi:hypothetical protein